MTDIASQLKLSRPGEASRLFKPGKRVARTSCRVVRVLGLVVMTAAALAVALPASAELLRLESAAMLVQVDGKTGQWSVLDKDSGVRWPSQGEAAPGVAKALEGEFKATSLPQRIVLRNNAGSGATFELVDEGRSLDVRYEGNDLGDVRALGDALAVTGPERGGVIVPCREGLWIPADSGAAFRHTFGTSDYEGCHMNMLGLIKRGSALVISWYDAYVFPELESKLKQGPSGVQRITTTLTLRRSARSFRLTPLGKGDWNTVAAGYRRIAEQKGLLVTLRDKIRRNAHAELLIGAANVKLWTCLARRMNEESTKEESVQVHWTFAEAAAIAEHLRKDLGIERCLFILGGWTEGGYDCRHPDNLPANPECGGNDALAAAIRRIQALGYVACLHDNYQDMYRDAKSWNPDLIERRPDGSLIQGGRWLGGRAYMVCAPKQLELAMRPQNLPEIHRLFGPWSYFIDCTFAVGPRECAAPAHPIGRNEDIAWKMRLSQYARELFGLFGSECGREWALRCSDFFEGLVGVSGRYFHGLNPATLGATVVPFWEMVYHDCQICYGKYGYAADQSAEYVAHHVLCARPLHYHSIPHHPRQRLSLAEHLYWKEAKEAKGRSGTPGGKGRDSPRACFTRTDSGWAEGLHPADAFLKNTHEVLGPLHQATAHYRLTRLELLAPDGSLRRAIYGQGEEATSVVVNFGPTDVSVQLPAAGAAVLPPFGFVIQSPRFAAFYAKSFNGVQYPDGAMFTVQAADGKNLDQTQRLRIFHAFGQPRIAWRGQAYEVQREQLVTLEPKK